MKELVTSEILNPKLISLGVKGMAAALRLDYQFKNPVLICVLKGAVVFMADLMREINFPYEIDFIQLKSYEGTKSAGKVKLIKDLDVDVADRHVIIIEDIVDTGLTLDFLRAHLTKQGAATVRCCTLLIRTSQTKNVEYAAFTLDGDSFVVGYGLDYYGQYRGLPSVKRIHERPS